MIFLLGRCPGVKIYLAPLVGQPKTTTEFQDAQLLLLLSCCGLFFCRLVGTELPQTPVNNCINVRRLGMVLLSGGAATWKASCHCCSSKGAVQHGGLNE